ncbi:MAG TPA: HEAT repeat domain-containing protein [Vicinamibacterales bacterium]|jgi:hypothetical protein
MTHHPLPPARASKACGVLLIAIGLLLGADRALWAQASVAAESLDAILREVSSYQGSIESAALWKLRDYVHARMNDPAGRAECEVRLLAFLKTPATPVARMAACRHLRLIAGDSAVPALQALLKDERSVDMALYVLRQIPGSVAGRALVQALTTSTGPARLAVISTIGVRRDADAVPALAPLLAQAEFARATVFALGAIGGDAAAQALTAAFAIARPDLKPVFASAVMTCAESFAAAKNDAAALRLYDTLWADASLPGPLRRAIAIGRISTSGPRGAAVLMDLLSGSDPGLQEAAITKIRDVVAPDTIQPICSLLPRLPEPLQLRLLSVLAAYPRERVLPTVLLAARSDSTMVRIASTNALAAAGDATVVRFLLDKSAKARGPEQGAARSALGRLTGRAVDEEILSLLGTKPTEDVERALLLAAADRQMFVAERVVVAALGSPSTGVRVQALRSLRVIGTPSDVPAVLEMLLRADDGRELSEAETTVGVLARKMANANDQSRAVTTRLAAEKDPKAKGRLIAVLPLIGQASALPVVRGALGDADPEVYDAAVRALTAWPTGAARDDIFRLARDSRNETHRLLAIHGLVRTVGLDNYRDPEAAVADLRSAAGFAWRPEEQKLVLGALTQFPCGEALDLAASFLREPSVKAEAEAAIEKIRTRMKKNES